MEPDDWSDADSINEGMIQQSDANPAHPLSAGSPLPLSARSPLSQSAGSPTPKSAGSPLSPCAVSPQSPTAGSSLPLCAVSPQSPSPGSPKSTLSPSAVSAQSSFAGSSLSPRTGSQLSPSATSPESPADEPADSVVEQSKHAQILIDLAVKVNVSRLDNLVASNGLKRIPVYPDGNCFFEASVLHLMPMTSAELRQALCAFIEDNMSEYDGFFRSDHDDDSTRYFEILSTLEALRKPGTWDTKANDVLPVALANFSKRQVKIFTSRHNHPVIDISPVSSSSSEPIYLALLAPAGLPEHYDGCLPQQNRDPSLLEHDIPSCPKRTFVRKAPEVLPNRPAAASHSEVFHSGPGSTAQRERCTATKAAYQSTTPSRRKSVVYLTPLRKTQYKKRAPNPSQWKSSVRKANKLKGLAYRSTSGVITRAKAVQPIDCSKCTKKCAQKIPEDKRQEIFDQFYSLESYERQKDFVCRLVHQTDTRTYLSTDGLPAEKKRKVARKFTFTLDGQSHSVCKTFFMKTLDIGQAYIEHALKNSEQGSFCGRDNRGRHTPATKIPEDRMNFVRRHIESFAAADSLYCRRSTNISFLDPNLSIAKMYELYCTDCKITSQEPVTVDIYRRTFNTEYNLSFHNSQKDQYCSRFSSQENK